MIVSTCGFGSTGSSVITDYLKEYNNVHVFDKVEIPWVAAVDGLLDLEYHLNNPHGRTTDSIWAIERYKDLCYRKASSFEDLGVPKEFVLKSVDDFLDSIIQTSWKWFKMVGSKEPLWRRVLERIIKETKLIEKWQIKNGLQWEGFPFQDVYFSVKPKDFDVHAKKHVSEIFNALGAKDGEILVFDQLFPGNNPQCCFRFFDDPYAIVVDRDPRDIYVFGKTVLLKNVTGHLMPLNDVKDFVIYYRALRDNQPYKEKNPKILRLNFEDLVYHYDESTSKLREFLKLPENPNPKSIFDPAISMPNTQVWKRFPQYSKDIEYIEKELSEYLFDFSGCPEPSKNGKMFFGKSPKNKD